MATAFRDPVPHHAPQTRVLKGRCRWPPRARTGNAIPHPKDCAMPPYDFRTPRLYVAAALGPGATLALDGAQANYLRNVLRLKAGDPVLVFNGREGEWRA